MRKAFFTRYKDNDRTFSTYLLAEDKVQAQRLITMRNLGEYIEGEMNIDEHNFPGPVMTRPHVLFRNVRKESTVHRITDVQNLLHQVVFIINLGQKSGRLDLYDYDLFGDNGGVHQCIHLLTMAVDEMSHVDQLIDFLRSLARTVPEMFFTAREIKDMQRRIDEIEDNRSICQVCDQPYRGDLIVTDDLWEQIKPKDKPEGAGLMCANCIVARIADSDHYSAVSGEPIY